MPITIQILPADFCDLGFACLAASDAAVLSLRHLALSNFSTVRVYESLWKMNLRENIHPKNSVIPIAMAMLLIAETVIIL